MIGKIISAVAVVLIIAVAVAYIIFEKKKGKKCIGCPYASACSRSNGGCSEKCQGNKEKNK